MKRRNLAIWSSEGTKTAFSGAMILGLLAQGMALLNKFSWHDDIFSLFLTGDTITSGRWMLHVLGEAEILLFGDGHFSLPLVNGLFSLLCIAASAGLLAFGLNIRSRGISFLLGGVMAVFPFVTALFSFMFTAHYYMLAMLMITLSGLLIGGRHPWWAKTLGILLGGCSVGIYQAFFPLLLTTVVLCDLSEMKGEEGRIADIWKTLVAQMLCIGGVMGTYLAGSSFFLNYYHLELSPYMGLNEAGSLPVGTYLARAGRAYAEFFCPTTNVTWDMFPVHIKYIRWLILLLEGILGIRMILQTWRINRGYALIQLLLLALFPLGCNFIFVLSKEVHGLMTYGQIAQFTLLTLLADRVVFQRAALTRLVAWVSAMMMGLSCVMYIRYDNQCYLKTGFQQQEAISWTNALIARIKSTKGYRDEYQIAWIGRDRMWDQSLYNIDELDFLHLSGYEMDLQGYLNNWTWMEFMARWCGFSSETANAEEFKNLPEVQAMPCYPEDGSIQVIGETVVVKFGEE